MTDNFTSILAGKVRKLSDEYFAVDGDTAVMQRIAREIAGTYRELAESDPAQRSTYQLHSAIWEERADVQDSISMFETEESTEYDDVIISMRLRPTIRFSDIGGCDALKKELIRTMVFSEIQSLPGLMETSNVLLYGPPGTGKTMMANAVANEMQKGSVYYNASLENMLSPYVGESSKRISALYDNARRSSQKAIIYLDELDAIGQARSSGDTSGASNRIVASMLLELDGSKVKNNPHQQPITIASCNCPWHLDSAILSRFEKQIYVGLPDEKAVESIIHIRTTGYTLSSSLSLAALGRECTTRLYAGRELRRLCKEAIETMIEDMNPRYYEEYLSLPASARGKLELRLRPLIWEDFESGLHHIRSPLSRADIEQYEAWNTMHLN